MPQAPQPTLAPASTPLRHSLCSGKGPPGKLCHTWPQVGLLPHPHPTHQHYHTPIQDASVVAEATVRAEQRILQAMAPDKVENRPPSKQKPAGQGWAHNCDPFPPQMSLLPTYPIPQEDQPNKATPAAIWPTVGKTLRTMQRLFPPGRERVHQRWAGADQVYMGLGHPRSGAWPCSSRGR